jgi:hypothetical protein
MRDTHRRAREAGAAVGSNSTSLESGGLDPSVLEHYFLRHRQVSDLHDAALFIQSGELGFALLDR